MSSFQARFTPACQQDRACLKAIDTFRLKGPRNSEAENQELVLKLSLGTACLNLHTFTSHMNRFLLCLCFLTKPSILFPFLHSCRPFPFVSLAPASQTSACRDCIHLQHTWGIKEGWNSLIHGWSEKKRKAQYSTAPQWREIFNEIWGLYECQCWISLWPKNNIIII